MPKLFPDLIFLTTRAHDQVPKIVTLQSQACVHGPSHEMQSKKLMQFSYAISAARCLAQKRRQLKAMAHILPAACLGPLIVPLSPVPIQTMQTAGGNPVSILT